MIQDNELRVGNWVNDGGECRQIAGPDFTFDLSSIEPIPLTPEILEAAGFKRVDDKFYHNWQMRGEDESYSVKESEGEYFFSNDYSDAWCHVLRDVKYLHQLQNLFYALTGSELTINLTEKINV